MHNLLFVLVLRIRHILHPEKPINPDKIHHHCQFLHQLPELLLASMILIPIHKAHRIECKVDMERNEVRLADCNKDYSAEVHDGYLVGNCAWLDADIIYAKVTKYYSRMNIVYPHTERQLAIQLADSGIMDASVVARENGGTKRMFRRKSSTPSRKPMQVLHLDLAQAYLEENGNN